MMSILHSAVDLINAVDERLRNVHTQSLDISFNELSDMVKEGELDISPDYQRLFQWSEGARSRFIESLLLEMPVPPIYMVEEEDNRKLLIDGLQRISSFLHFRGMLKAEHLDPPIEIGQNLILQECDIVPELNGKTYNDLGTALQIKLKRSFVRVEVIRKGSDPRFKYHMFKRLNTGGEPLTPQQLRNCTIRLLNDFFINFINTCARDVEFKNCISTLSEDQLYANYDSELVLRFFALKNYRSSFRHDVSEFLTDYLEAVSDPEIDVQFDQVLEKSNFEKTFLILSKTLGERVFSRSNKALNNLISGFGIYHFEAFSIGLQSVIQRLNPSDQAQMEQLEQIFMSIKFDRQFINMTTGGGKNSPGLLNARISFVSDKIEAAI